MLDFIEKVVLQTFCLCNTYINKLQVYAKDIHTCN